MKDYINGIRSAFIRLHGCDATYVETVRVTERFEGKTIWQGDVAVFDIRGHRKATRGYGWGYVTGDAEEGTRYFAVLELPPVDSPQAAVRWIMTADTKNAKRKT